MTSQKRSVGSEDKTSGGDGQNKDSLVNAGRLAQQPENCLKHTKKKMHIENHKSKRNIGVMAHQRCHKGGWWLKWTESE